MKDTTENKSITEALVSKKPATAAKLFQEAMDQRLSEVEAPANFWNAGMARANPIKVSQPQPAEPGQFKAANVKSPTRLADRDSALEGAPKATRAATEAEATRRGPEKIELTGDWQADIPDHQFDPKLDSETEFYPLFSQFKSLGVIPSGPAMAWEEEQIYEISKETLGSYVKKAADNLGMHASIGGGSTGADTKGRAKAYGVALKRSRGVGKATDKLTGIAKVPAGEKQRPIEMLKRIKEELADDKENPDELNEISKKTLGSYVKKASVSASLNTMKSSSDQNASDFYRREVEKHPDYKGAADLAKSYYKKSAEHNLKAVKRLRGISQAIDKLVKEDKKKVDPVDVLDEGLFDPASHELLSLWDEHARRSDAHGSGSRAEILKRIESHVVNKHGQEGLKKMRLHSDLTNALKHSTAADKGHLQAILGNMRAKCALEG